MVSGSGFDDGSRVFLGDVELGLRSHTILESNGQSVVIAARSKSLLSFSVPRSETYSFKVSVPPPGGGEASIDLSTFLECD